MLTINVAVFLAIIVVVRLRRRTESRSRLDEKLTVVIVLLLGILIAPTDVGQTLLHATGQVVQQMAQVKFQITTSGACSIAVRRRATVAAAVSWVGSSVGVVPAARVSRSVVAAWRTPIWTGAVRRAARAAAADLLDLAGCGASE